MNLSIFNESAHRRYNNKEIINKIKVIRFLSENKPRSKKIDKMKLEIFFTMKNLVIKNINNYSKYTQNSKISELAYNSIEMENEAFIILDNCIRHFKYKYDFYFYFNKSLSRNFYRMFSKDLRQNDKDIVYKTDLFHRKKDEFLYCNIEIDIFNLGFDELDMIVLKSKMNDETKDVFMKNNPNFQMSKYYTCMKKIKKILTTLKENDEL
jgi:hypothetical protein